MKMRTGMHGEGAGPQGRWKHLVYGMLAATFFLLIATAAAQAAPTTADAPRITKEDAKALLGAPKVVFLDARVASAWNSSDKKISGAVRNDRSDYETWAKSYDKDTTFIVYCT